MANPFDTDEVTNQPPPFEDVNLFAADTALQEAVAREGAGPAAKKLQGFGFLTGSAGALERGRLANLHRPVLESHDRFGRRIERVVYHPSYHDCLEAGVAEGLHASAAAYAASGAASPRPGAHVERAAGFYLSAQMEAGHCAALSMTSAAIAVLLRQPDLAERWVPKLVSKTYDPSLAPIEDKQAALAAIAITEKQAGSDVRAVSTQASPDGAGGPGAAYRLSGHKWFLPAPMADSVLVLAKSAPGLSCFLVPRYLDGGGLNGLRLTRLKDMLGCRSCATAEAEFADATGWLIGEEGKGEEIAAQIALMGYLDDAVTSAGLMRFAVASAIHHAEHRTVSGKKLSDQALMVQVLADLALDVEAAAALSFRLARAFDRSSDKRAAAWRRLMAPVTKYWVCKIAPAVIAEAMECHGGNGYCEEAPLARLYRDAQGVALRSAPGNVLALEVMHILQREPEIAETVMEELGQAAAGDQHLTAAHRRLENVLHEPRFLDGRARLLVEGLAVLAAGTILRAHVLPAFADAFIATRMGSLTRQTYGQGLDWADTRGILKRASPNHT